MTARVPPPPRAILRWYLEAGVDEAILEHPVNRFRTPVPPAVDSDPEPRAETPDPSPPRPQPSGEWPLPAPPRTAPPTPPVAGGAVESATVLAARAATLEELRQTLESFDACPLRATATGLVFGDGAPSARLVLIGEAPGAEEDRRGLPFVGPSGRLLDKMLASIGLDRSKVFISNTVFWRPPGNRSPTSSEVATCMPFVERLIELVEPRVVVALGGPAANALLGMSESVGRLRGRWFPYQTGRMARPAAATVLFHPAYLLRSPAQKRLAWRDLLTIEDRINTD